MSPRAKQSKARSETTTVPRSAEHTARGGGTPDKVAAAKKQAARFSRTRQDHAGEIAEDYVELVSQLIREEGEARTVDIARRLGVSHVTVTKTIARLRKEGLVRSEPYRAIFLTAEGQTLAKRAAARHELLVRFLRDLGVNPTDAEADAEGMEHHVSEATIRAIQQYVDARGRSCDARK